MLIYTFMELRAGISLAAIEQWGYQTVHGTNPVTYDLPIPFEEAPFTVAISTGNSGNHASCGGFTKTTIVLRAGTTAGVWDTVGFFIIGCQLQWGFTVFDPVYYKNVNFTLPLSVNGTFCAFSTGYDAKGSTFLWHSMSHFNNVNVGVTGFVFDSRYTFTGLGYLAVCWQKQWGENVGGGGQTVSLPISFEVAFTAVVSADSSWCNASCHITTTTITTMNYQSNRPDIAQAGPVQWLAIGIQPQWGYAGGSRGTFPIAFGQFFSMASVLNNAIEAWERACYNITNTSFQINYGGPILYLAIGKA